MMRPRHSPSAPGGRGEWAAMPVSPRLRAWMRRLRAHGHGARAGSRDDVCAHRAIVASARRGITADAARRFAAPASQRGMSLLEMLLVIALIAAVGVLTVAALNGGMAGMQLRSASKEIASQLRYTRSQAIASGRSQKFTIDPGARTWTAPNGRSGDIPKAIGIVFTGAREVQPRRGEGAIMFFADGASTGGRVKLTAKQAAWNVDVAWLTGEVKLKRGEPRQ